MQSHFSGGMAIALLDGVDKWPSVPTDAGKTCQGNGKSNSTWTPSCFCPASCAANPSTNSSSSSGSSGSSSGTSASTSSGSGSDSGSGSWVNGVWVGGSSPSTSNDTGSYTASPDTGSYTGSASNSTTSGPVKTYTGAASTRQVSLFTLLALAVAALSL